MNRNRDQRNDSKNDPKQKPSHRTTRVEGDMREVIASYLLVSLRGELPGFVSITRVIISKDLRQAKVLFTVMDAACASTAALNKLALESLQAHAPEIQNEINRRLRMKFCPRLTFHHDSGFDDAIRIEGILNEITKKREADEKRAEEQA